VNASLPSLSLLTLAAHAPPHWEFEYREVDEIGDPAALQGSIETGRFDLIALSALSARILETYALADRLRAAGQTVVLGGLHVSALPREAMAHADAVVQGEGELHWAELLADAERGRLRPIYSARERTPFRLEDSLPPRYDLLDVQRYDRLTLQTSRGCPLDCSFCAASRTISSYKRKPIERVRGDLEQILDLWPRPFLELADDNTFASKPWSRDLARLLGEYDLLWFTETDISVADDDALLELLATSGCKQLLIGLEAVSPAALQGVDGRDWKSRRAADYLDAVRKIQSFGIPVNGCFVFGLDGDGPEAFDRTRDFVAASGLCDVQITLLTPFPGTALHRQLGAEGRLFREVYWDECTLFDLTFTPKRMSADELTAGFRELMADLYGPAATAGRRTRLRECLRAGNPRRGGAA
jgi:radical SAM superfamily enzyme YgiQ (UPF0313 family)